MTAREIIENYLKQNGFDGLFCDGCGCEVGHISCGYIECECMPGYKHEGRKTCPPDCKESCWERDFTVMFCARPVYKAVQCEN